MVVRNRIRLYSGLILFLFVTGHFINHSMGIVSLDLMNRASEYFIDPWQSPIGSALLYGSFIVHIGVALYSLMQRRTLVMPGWEVTQLVAGFLAPVILAAHVSATKGLSVSTDFIPDYATTLNVFWNFSPWRGALQSIALVVVWIHSCVGLHHWLRIYPVYQRYAALAFSLALITPTLALAGYVSAGMEILQLANNPDWVPALLKAANFKPEMLDMIAQRETNIQVATISLICIVLLFRVVRDRARNLRQRPRLYYSPDNRVVELQRDATLLESIRRAGIPHASVCGGRGRCSTCRVRISSGLEHLPLPGDDEEKILSRLTNSPSVRLACQIRPTQDLTVSALVRVDTDPHEATRHPGYRQGKELTVAFMFVDLRGSTRLSEERLPFDVVFILNQFFAELSLALTETNGHYAQFNGDGLLAIYGLQSGAEQGCREAISGAQAIFARMEQLNARLHDELGHDLEIGIGIHAGEAIIGSMGPPQSPIVSALGDNVNIAARLEAQTKELGAPLVLSARTARYAGIDFSHCQMHTIHVKGRVHPIDVYAVDDMEKIMISETL